MNLGAKLAIGSRGSTMNERRMTKELRQSLAFVRSLAHLRPGRLAARCVLLRGITGCIAKNLTRYAAAIT